jgi:hypothetical protein
VEDLADFAPVLPDIEMASQDFDGTFGALGPEDGEGEE